MVKKEIRKAYTDYRNNLTNDEISERSERILDNFMTLSLQGTKYLLSYYPIHERREFDVTLCENLLSLETNDLIVAWPRLLEDNVSMEAAVKTKDTKLVRNKFNIAEPVDTEILDVQLIDVVFVPLLAFDTKGYRVGYGKGFYDRFLPRCAQDVVKIGFSYFEAVDIIDDVNEYDVPLNFCITPARVYEF